MKFQKLLKLSVMSLMSLSAHAQIDSSSVKPFNAAVKIRVAKTDSLVTKNPRNNTVGRARQKNGATPKTTSLPVTLPALNRRGVALFGSDTVSLKHLKEKK